MMCNQNDNKIVGDIIKNITKETLSFAYRLGRLDEQFTGYIITVMGISQLTIFTIYYYARFEPITFLQSSIFFWIGIILGYFIIFGSRRSIEDILAEIQQRKKDKHKEEQESE